MNIAQALKNKNRVIGEMNKLFSFVEKHNIESKKSGTERGSKSPGATPEAVVETFQKYLELSLRLTEIKTAIQVASAPIASKLVALAETKSLLSKIGAIPVREAVSIEGGYGKETYEVEHTSAITEKMQIDKTAELQKTINDLQDEIDAYNATTQVQLS